MLRIGLRSSMSRLARPIEASPVTAPARVPSVDNPVASDSVSVPAPALRHGNAAVEGPPATVVAPV